ncbi:MAG: hypothetical protein JWO44_1630 [Bacteroidetes bacterium]|nr:hypothetical protein [Bacteroidota bacterium]
MKKKIYKVVAVYLAINILFEIISPTVALALTTGPSQPEMQSFEPIGTTEMVDPFSGDFNYNIPLMTVPGPNGGYPINLAYHAGIGMEQEASWVGLGWNINAGEINRQMRGLPDDFNGDAIGKVMYMKPNVSAMLKTKFSLEMASLDLDYNLSLSSGLTYNSYHGIGLVTGAGLSVGQRDAMGFGGGVQTNYNSLSGEQDISATLSYSKKQGDNERKYGLSFTYGSAHGAKDLSFEYSKTVKNSNSVTGMVRDGEGGVRKTVFNVDKNGSHSAGVSFAGSSYIPHAEMPRGGFSVSAAFDFGPDVALVNPYFGGEAFYSQDKIKQNSLSLKGYGYMYAQSKQSGDGNDLALMDFNREKDAQLTKDIPAMPVPVFTNDIFFVQGQGIGGAFMPHRSDIGILYDPVTRAKNRGIDVGLEIGMGPPTFKVGGDMTLSYSNAYYGPWRNASTWSDLNGPTHYEFKNRDLTKPLYEPFYFRSAGDMTANYDEDKTTLKGISDYLPLSYSPDFSLGSFADADLDEFVKPIIDFKVSKGALTDAQLETRPSRSQVMSYRTNANLHLPNASSAWSNNTLYDKNEYPRNSSGTTPDYSLKPNDHIGEITVVNADGNRYIYGIAAYNTAQKEVTFSVEGDVPGQNNPVLGDRKLVNYEADDVSSSNSKGNDNFYSYKSLPPYAHSYLLTAIVSPDYVDLTGDGLTDDDYGYYVKFNYSKLGNFNWRSPFLYASYIQGYESEGANDDKAGYTYGSKDIWYLNSVETKTHIAEFSLSDRRDGYGANNENNGAIASGAPTITLGSLALQKLDMINLYSKSDPGYASGTPTPIKTVHFDYTYDLCGGVLNNVGTSTGSEYYTGLDKNVNHGKLTLKKVWFTYLNNNKGYVSPYEFDYHERNTYGGTINTVENPGFSTMQMDRWGNYKSVLFDPEDPYTDQHSETTPQETLRNNNASAWCLKGITLPSGGKIEVAYESDDYAFVQDKQAMQMAKIAGTGHVESSNVVRDNGNSIDDNNLLVFFELESQAHATKEWVWKYVKGIDDMYFKTYQRLKRRYATTEFTSDYVSGYAKIDATDAPDVENGEHYGVYEITSGHYVGYVKVKPVNVHDNNNTGGDKTHPFRKAGWQYLKLNRPDLLYPSSSGSLSDNPAASELLSLVTGVVGFFTSNIQLFAGYYNYCAIHQFCNRIDLSKSSFIRLNSPDFIKYGGGNRVKQISISDTWAHTGAGDELSVYGQQYSYTLPDGSSSGVAEYEPLIGGEEIALRKPIRYSSDYLLLKHDDLYMEEPLCESYYPAAGVGYSRIIVKSITQKDDQAIPADVTKGTQGISVYEYYTAKDFPVMVSSSGVLPKNFNPHLNIPFIGNVSFENHAHSQTYTVETNDMHGKLKSMATYSYGTDLMSPQTPSPVTKTEYVYKTDAPYTPTGLNHLNNMVDALYDDAFYKTSSLGLTKDFFIDMRESSTTSMTNGGQVNVEVTYPAIVYCLFLPKVSYSEGINKSVVGMNVISRNGVLMETKQYSEGAMASTKNLMFDAATGKPLLTQVTNDFDAPVYSYEYASQWAYDGMGAAYKNIGALLRIDKITTGTFHMASGFGSTNPKQYFSEGDEITGFGSHPGEVYYVTNVTSTSFDVKDNTNASYSDTDGLYTVTILRSGRRNHLSSSNGSIVSLSNPVTTRKFPLFEAWNTYVAANAGALPSGTLTFTECASGNTIDAALGSGTNSITFTFAEEQLKCENVHAQFASPLYTSYLLKKMGPHVMAIELSTVYPYAPTGSTMIGNWHDDDNCLKECLDDVLHASAMEMRDDFSYDYDDADNNQMILPLHNFAGYAAGEEGVWRPEQSWLYQVDRKQGSPATNIAKDGTYLSFLPFNWSTHDNPKWTWANKITRYSPYGYEIENEDRMGIYSAALYGYNNSVPVAIASNASYYETAFDSFEDYLNNNYSMAPAGHKHGHINLAVNGSGSLAINSSSHTGSYSMQIPSGASARFVASSAQHFSPATGKSYMISAWFKGDAGSTPAITVPSGGSVVSATLSGPIEGWRKCDVVFTASGSGAITFDFNIGSSTLKLVDDIRIMPFESGIKTYVYNPQTLWLVAELDNQNFATFYNYDQEGTLVQVKKETAQGIRTIKTTRSNVKRNL